jgi:hypothetical protein
VARTGAQRVQICASGGACHNPPFFSALLLDDVQRVRAARELGGWRAPRAGVPGDGPRFATARRSACESKMCPGGASEYRRPRVEGAERSRARLKHGPPLRCQSCQRRLGGCILTSHVSTGSAESSLARGESVLNGRFCCLSRRRAGPKSPPGGAVALPRHCAGFICPSLSSRAAAWLRRQTVFIFSVEMRAAAMSPSHNIGRMPSFTPDKHHLRQSEGKITGETTASVPRSKSVEPDPLADRIHGTASFRETSRTSSGSVSNFSPRGKQQSQGLRQLLRQQNPRQRMRNSEKYTMLEK